MIDGILLRSASWLLFAFFGVQALVFIGLILRVIWTDAIRPRLIPAAEIDRVAAGIVARHADPEEEAFARHEAARHRSDGARQVYWHRVRKAVRRRLRDRQAAE